MVTCVLWFLALSAFGSFMLGVANAHNLWIGDEPNMSSVLLVVYAVCLVFEIRAFQWVYALDQRFDLTALAQSAGL